MSTSSEVSVLQISRSWPKGNKYKHSWKLDVTGIIKRTLNFLLQGHSDFGRYCLSQRPGNGTSANHVTPSVYGRYRKRCRKGQWGHYEDFFCWSSFLEDFTKGMSILAYLMTCYTTNLQDFECRKLIYIWPKYWSCMYLALYKLVKTITKMEHDWLLPVRPKHHKKDIVHVMLVIGQYISTACGACVLDVVVTDFSDL